MDDRARIVKTVIISLALAFGTLIALMFVVDFPPFGYLFLLIWWGIGGLQLYNLWVKGSRTEVRPPAYTGTWGAYAPPPAGWAQPAPPPGRAGEPPPVAHCPQCGAPAPPPGPTGRRVCPYCKTEY